MTVRAQTGPGPVAQRVATRPAAPLNSPRLAPRTLAALAAACLVIDDARIYGVIDSGPIIDRQRCLAVLRDLRDEGIVPTPEEAEVKALELMAELGVVRP